ncbi:glycosyltransferase family 4 protein [Spirulina major CS-329]|uniref:glycosyltransferase family 4 protein n=1 Tax=Spirulina TaxID=1154 RepID=UPI0023305152|nr:MULTISPECIES: glycosyltransferase family 4 protein [Spirulina]MDB9493738.1 glycosyltransferase family 4 protein [Spirulina subsalsa CS-330]MDB9501956.1 glycosyltransferase family 4 protein [Spirulina major CS-329]
MRRRSLTQDEAIAPRRDPMTEARSLRILILLHMPLQRDFGGSRVQLELAELWRSWGHTVEVFDLNAAFPNLSHSLWATLTRPHFSQKARQYVRQQGDRFDVIDAHQGNLPFTKRELGITGLLVARSVGMYPLYHAFEHQRGRQGPKPRSWQGWIVRWLLAWRDRHEVRRCLTSFRQADLINLPNPAEQYYLEQTLHLGQKCRVFPFGLSAVRRQALGTVLRDPAQRLGRPVVTLIGTWCDRKGSQDWGTIIRQVHATRPEVRFRLLGTRSPRSVVLRDLALSDGDWLEVIPNYDSEALPDLLATTTVGAFPSYIEGFGFAVLEKLAAGIPTVAYDIPGPQTMLNPVDPALLVPVGDAIALAAQLLAILNLAPDDYCTLAHRCHTVAADFAWERIAADTLTAYRAALAALNP